MEKRNFEKEVIVSTYELDSFEGRTELDRLIEYCTERFGCIGLEFSLKSKKTEDKFVIAKLELHPFSENEDIRLVKLPNQQAKPLTLGEITLFDTMKSLKEQIGGEIPFIVLDKDRRNEHTEFIIKVLNRTIVNEKNEVLDADDAVFVEIMD